MRGALRRKVNRRPAENADSDDDRSRKLIRRSPKKQAGAERAFVCLVASARDGRSQVGLLGWYGPGYRQSVSHQSFSTAQIRDCSTRNIPGVWSRWLPKVKEAENSTITNSTVVPSLLPDAAPSLPRWQSWGTDFEVFQDMEMEDAIAKGGIGITRAALMPQIAEWFDAGHRPSPERFVPRCWLWRKIQHQAPRKTSTCGEEAFKAQRHHC